MLSMHKALELSVVGDLPAIRTQEVETGGQEFKATFDWPNTLSELESSLGYETLSQTRKQTTKKDHP